MRHLVRLIAALTFIVILAGMVAGCGDDPEEAEVKQVLTDQLEFLRAEDIEGVLSTMHPESPQYAATRSLLEQVFELYELDHELESIEVVEMSEKEAKIRAVQVTYRVDGPELSDTKVTAIHTMRKTDGGWKLYNSETESSETL